MQAIGQQPRRASAGAPVRDERHRPEQIALHRLVQQHVAPFMAHTEASTGLELSRFINDEFEAFLACGILTHGFLRLRCGEFGHNKLLAFSCKRRGCNLPRALHAFRPVAPPSRSSCRRWRA